jgi:hypothetical protein
MANTLEWRAKKLLVERWNACKTSFSRLNMPGLRPTDGEEIFSLIDYPKVAGQIGFNVKSVVFNLPERANGSPDLFVVVHGRLYFDEDSIRLNLLRTSNFATEAAYFKKKSDELIHVYGAHCDFAQDVSGHPAFHVQMRSFAGQFDQVAKYFNMTDVASRDLMGGVLRNVRLPSAQIDFFSLVLQLCADHLIDENSGAEELMAFSDLMKASAEIHGAAYLVPQLSNPSAQACLRANHWYP